LHRRQVDQRDAEDLVVAVLAGRGHHLGPQRQRPLVVADADDLVEQVDLTDEYAAPVPRGRAVLDRPIHADQRVLIPPLRTLRGREIRVCAGECARIAGLLRQRERPERSVPRSSEIALPVGDPGQQRVTTRLEQRTDASPLQDPFEVLPIAVM
jgi:hypothetical protein